MNNQSKVLIGAQEWCAFPELGIPAIKMRVDSGAKTSSIHAFDIKKFERDGVEWVSFDVHPLQRDKKTTKRCEHVLVDRRHIKSSTGEQQKRYVIRTQMQMGDLSYDIDLTLANRDSMGFRMLLGREAMNGRVIIDPGQTFCLGRISRLQMKGLYK
ncbi:MAG: hypothetical protein AUK35_03120 [Zetaproteobacteria bacterium CG2_30_46_52]|nr:MAG: hypothetical protein AUK35_03120 [Zetaproteobacteria bacterium CG2_30_46_52]